MQSQCYDKPATADASVAQRVLQRKCDCGQHTIAGGDCAACGNERRSLRQSTWTSERGSRNSESMPAIVHKELHSPRPPVDFATSGLMEPGFGYDFSRVPTRTAAPASRKDKLRVSQPDDDFEKEADRIAGDVMRTFDGALVLPIAQDASSQRLSLARQAKPDSKPVPEFGERDVMEAADSEVNPQTEGEVLSSVGGGAPLPETLRDIFEPRFGHDLSHVRVHTGQAAAATAQSLQAVAFTFGSDIFFNNGEYRPEASSGLALLAHELSHVIQQQSGSVSRRLIQRAKISYRTLTWANFKGTADENSQFAAETSSGFDGVTAKSKQATDNLGTKCKLGTRDLTDFKATISSDPAVFDKISALMNEEESWVKRRNKDNGNAFCTEEVKTCEKYFDKEAGDARKNCQQSVTKCQEAFKQGAPNVSIGEDAEKLTVTSSAECATTFFRKCQELAMKDVQTSVTDEDGNDVATAKKKADCKTSFSKQCTDHEIAESKRLLKHEQGHFDISNVMAKNAKASLKAKAATLTVTETRCGKAEALKAAQASFDNLDASAVLSQLQQDWITSWEQAESDYDVETDHGDKKVEQSDWEKTKIGGGLKTYDPTAPVAPPAPPAAPPAAPSPAPTP
jgi:hypothetical protein